MIDHESSPKIPQVDPTESLHLVQSEEYISVREAARRIGVSPRSVYGYLETGKLPGLRVGSAIAVYAEAVLTHERHGVGRPRTRTPIWRAPVLNNLQYLLTIRVRLREGKEAHLEEKLQEIGANRSTS